MASRMEGEPESELRKSLRLQGGAVAALCRTFWWDSDRRVRSEACLRLSALVGVMLFRGRTGVWLSQIRRKQIETILQTGGKSRDALQAVVRYVLAAIVLTPVNKLYWRLFRGIRLLWERHLTLHLLKDFLTAQCLNGGQQLDVKEVRHPDQRIAADVGKFCSLVTMLGLDTLQSAIDLFFYSQLLGTMSPFLARAVVVMAALGTVISFRLGRSLPNFYAAERVADGHFTYLLTRMRENAESIVFYGGQHREEDAATDALELRQSTEWRRLALKDVVQLASENYKKCVTLLPTVILARATIGKVSAALLAQANEAFEVVLRSLSVLADNCNDFSRLSAVAGELYGYHCSQQAVGTAKLESQKLDKCDCKLQEGQGLTGDCGNHLRLLPTDDPRVSEATASASPQQWLRITDLTLCLQERALFSHLHVEAPAQGGLLITGLSGCGKTSLLRAIAGLWRQGGSGVIHRPMQERKLLFLPQQPYMNLGSLRDQLLYPWGASGTSDDHSLQAILRRVRLTHLQDELDSVHRWDEHLSVGEQQRIAIARLLVHRPAYAILDEVTSANDSANEIIMYQAIADTCTAYCSVGHRPSLERFHQQRLELLGLDGKWQLSELSSA